MAYSTQTVVSDGTLTLLGVTIDYFERPEIRVLFEGVVVPPEAGLWAWVGSTSKNISFTPAVGNGVQIELQRTTDVDEMRHTFSGGSQLRADTLDENFVQLLHVAQESQERGGGVGGGVTTFNSRDGDVTLLQSDVTALGFVPGGGSGGVSSWNARTGAVTMTSLDVTTALGYVPSAGTSGVNSYAGRSGIVVPIASDLAAAGLGAAGGSAMVGYQRSGGGTLRTLSQFLATQRVTPEEFGAVGDGVADDTIPFQIALNTLTPGQALYCTKRYRLASNVNVPRGTSIQGNFEVPGNAYLNTGPALPYGTMQSALVLDSTATINLGWNAGVRGLLIHRNGMNFPEIDSTGYAGTAIIGTGDDTFMHNCMVLGFTQAFYSNGHGRIDIRVCNIDCNAGIDIRNCLDVSYVERVHCWPFVTITGTISTAGLHRSGAAFRFQDVGDWNKVTDCFSYGYFRGYLLHSVSAMTLLSCSADGTQAFVGQIGFEISGNTNDARLISCQAAGQYTGYYFHAPEGNYASMVGCDAWSAATNSVAVDSGDVSIFQGHLRDCAQGVASFTAVGKVTVADVCFRRVSGASILNAGATPTLYIRNNLYITVGSSLPDFPATGGGGGGTAASITFSPAGTVASTNVQSAIVEVANEAARLAGSSSQAFQVLTPPFNDNSVLAASTAWYWSQASSSVPPPIVGTGGVGTSGRWAREDHWHAAHASNVVYSPSPGISSTTVQLAIQELSSEKADLTGNLTQPFQSAAYFGGYANFNNVASAGSPALFVKSYNPTVKPAIEVDGSMNSVAYPSGATGVWRSNGILPIVHNTYELGNGASAWSAIFSQTAVIITSDERAKTDIEDSPLGLDFVNALRPVAYRYKVGAQNVDRYQRVTQREGRRIHYGLLAQQVKAVLGDRDAGIWVSADPTDPEAPQMLRYEELISPMIKAIQELTQRVAELENKE